MTFLHRTIGATAIAAAALIGANLPAMADEITFSGAQLGSLTLTNSPDGDGTASFISSTDVIRLSSGNHDTVTGASTNAQFATAMQDAGSVTINGSFGTLNNVLAQSANYSFTTTSVTNSSAGTNPYWQVLLRDPSNAANTLLINSINPGNNTFGTSGSASLTGTGHYNNPFTQLGGPFPTAIFPPDGSFNPNANLWSTIAAVLDDGTALGNWNVAALGIADGGFNGGGTTSADISSISVSTTPLPSTWTMMLAGFAGFGWLLYRRRREGEAAARFA